MPRQLHLDLTFDGTSGAGEFIVADPNRMAVEKLQNYAQWAEPGIVIFGPAGCGKSTLARLWGTRVGAVDIHDAKDTADYLAGDSQQPVMVDDAEAFAATHGEALFHLHQRLVATGTKMVLLASRPAQQWDIRLADIASRVRALPQVEIAAPNDALTEMLLLKYFTERGIAADPDIVNFLLPRVPRHADELRVLIQALDTDALEAGRRLTITGVRAWAKEKGL